MVFIGGAWVFYASVPYFQRYFEKRSPFFGEAYTWWQVLMLAASVYVFLLVLYYLLERAPGTSKSILALRALRRFGSAPVATWQNGLPTDERLGLLSVLLKAFFAPLMVVSLFDFTVRMLGHGNELLLSLGTPEPDWLALFNAHGYWFVFQLILVLDVFFFTLGYLIELPVLKNEIRSVDPTLLGWGVTLACYPPFNQVTALMFDGSYAVGFAQFEHPVVHVAVNSLLLGLMAIYGWASVALNFKASNLTHRGIIAKGPYRFVRHPAYIAKNLAWLIAMMPALLVLLETSLVDSLVMVGSAFGWTVIYYMRAITEEDHLRSVDGEYDAYCQKVKYRFIPGVI